MPVTTPRVFTVTDETEIPNPKVLRYARDCSDLDDIYPVRLGMKDHFYTFNFVADNELDSLKLARPVLTSVAACELPLGGMPMAGVSHHQQY